MPRAPPPPLPPARMEVVEAAWEKVSRGADAVPLDQFKEAYDATRHPRVLDGNMAAGQARDMIATHFDVVPDGKVTWDEFLQYHVKMSLEVDRGRALNRDATFINVVVQAWRLDRDSATAMEPTGIIATSLDCPTGLKQTRNLDLLWPDPRNPAKALCGFRSVIRSRFGRGVLPPALRGHFAYTEETTEFKFTPTKGRSSLVAPLSIVWRDPENPEQFYGLRDVVAPNVDVTTLPPHLAELFVAHDTADREHGAALQWLPLEKATSPAYVKSSEAVGHRAQESAEELLTVKKKVYEGTNAGIAWYGHTGKFTDSFKGGAFRTSGLNTSKSF